MSLLLFAWNRNLFETTDQQVYLAITRLVRSQGPSILINRPSFLGSVALNWVGLALPGFVPVSVFVGMIAISASMTAQYVLILQCHVVRNAKIRFFSRYGLLVFPSGLFFLSLPLKEPFIVLGLTGFGYEWINKRRGKRLFASLSLVALFRFYLVPLLVVGLLVSSALSRAKRPLLTMLGASWITVYLFDFGYKLVNGSGLSMRFLGSEITAGRSLLKPVSFLGILGNLILRAILFPLPSFGFGPFTLAILSVESLVFATFFSVTLRRSSTFNKRTTQVGAVAFSVLFLDAAISANAGTLLRLRLTFVPLVLLALLPIGSSTKRPTAKRTSFISRNDAFGEHLSNQQHVEVG